MTAKDRDSQPPPKPGRLVRLKSGRGGRRAGAGRKADPDRKYNITVALSQPVIAWLRAQPESQGQIVERAIRAAYPDIPPRRPDKK
jgi:hypothetical protein